MKIKILIIDDDPDWLKLYVDQMNDTGDFEAIGLVLFDELVFEEFSPDVVLVDIMLGEVDGFEILKIIREKTERQKAVLMSSSKEAVERAKTKDLIALVKGYGLGPSSPMALAQIFKTMCR